MIMQMGILSVTPKPTKKTSFSYYKFSFNSSNISGLSRSFITCSTRKRSQQPGDSKDNNNNNDDSEDKKSGDKFSTDWDKAWSSFKKQGKKSLTSQFSPNKYVSWNPRRSNYPLSEEVDPIKRTERANLLLWTSPKFTLGLAIVIVSLLLVYTLLAPMK
ncbi:uncharacterized protein LOC130827654 [Amaranthus tricolor]|uniref:uncharacterized protein LOC130827654 n=1 Tax=Amaranthus tricolor TaxID=29722 RepID=UPI002588DE81|nr:uncharacterized protein LOC130827654 [Amaranthus tricolor]